MKSDTAGVSADLLAQCGNALSDCVTSINNGGGISTLNVDGAKAAIAAIIQLCRCRLSPVPSPRAQYGGLRWQRSRYGSRCTERVVLTSANGLGSMRLRRIESKSAKMSPLPRRTVGIQRLQRNVKQNGTTRARRGGVKGSELQGVRQSLSGSVIAGGIQLSGTPGTTLRTSFSNRR